MRSLPCERDDPGTEAACEEQRAVLKEDAHRWETKRRSQGEQEKAREAGKSEEQDLTEPRGEGLRRGTLHRSESCRKVRRTRGRSLPVGGSRVAVWERARAGEWTGRSTDQEERRRGGEEGEVAGDFFSRNFVGNGFDGASFPSGGKI